MQVQHHVYEPSMKVGNYGGGAGLLRVQDGSTLNVAHKLAVGGGYGALNQTGGSVTLGGDLDLSWYGGQGVLNQSGGTFTHNTRLAIIAGLSGGTGLINLSGTASYTQTSNRRQRSCKLGNAGTARGILNISDSATFTVPSSSIAVGYGRERRWHTEFNGRYRFSPKYIQRRWRTRKQAYVNFNGGTLKPTASSTNLPARHG